MKIPLDEVKHFLGMRQDVLPSDIDKDIENIAGELEETYVPRYIYRRFELEKQRDGFFVPGADMKLKGKTAESMLSDCDEIVILACTVGSRFDAAQRREQAKDMKRAVIADACGSALAEAGCDTAEKEIAALAAPKFLTDRFSAGYGDLPLSMQKQIASVLDLQRKLGIYVDDNYIMNPSKSVTAFIGISEKPQKAVIRGCDFCALRENCALRGKGKSCAN